MNDIQDSAMVALLPSKSDWAKVDPPHTTIIYLGKISELDPLVREELIKIVSSLAILTTSFKVKILGQEVFGSDEKVEVFRLFLSQELSSLRTILDSWDDSSFPVFKPHATIGPVGTVVNNPPLFLMFDRLLLSWGEERLIFQLRQN